MGRCRGAWSYGLKKLDGTYHPSYAGFKTKKDRIEYTAQIKSFLKDLETRVLNPTKLITAIMYIMRNWYFSAEPFFDDYSQLSDTFGIGTEIQADFLDESNDEASKESDEPDQYANSANTWVALLNLNLPIINKYAANEDWVSASLAILSRLNAHLPPDLRMRGYLSAGTNVGRDEKVSIFICKAFVEFILEQRNRAEDYIAKSFVLNGKQRQHYLEILQSRFRENWNKESAKALMLQATEHSSGTENENELSPIPTIVIEPLHAEPIKDK